MLGTVAGLLITPLLSRLHVRLLTCVIAVATDTQTEARTVAPTATVEVATDTAAEEAMVAAAEDTAVGLEATGCPTWALASRNNTGVSRFKEVRIENGHRLTRPRHEHDAQV